MQTVKTKTPEQQHIRHISNFFFISNYALIEDTIYVFRHKSIQLLIIFLLKSAFERKWTLNIAK